MNYMLFSISRFQCDGLDVIHGLPVDNIDKPLADLPFGSDADQGPALDESLLDLNFFMMNCLTNKMFSKMFQWLINRESHSQPTQKA